MAKLSCLFPFLAIIIISTMAASLTIPPPPPPPSPSPMDCMKVINKMMYCIPFLSTEKNASVASEQCCVAVSQVILTSPLCYCFAIEQAKLLGINVNNTRAKELPKDCGASMPAISHCGDPKPPPPPLLPLLPPPSTPTKPSPTPATPPPPPTLIVKSGAMGVEAPVLVALIVCMAVAAATCSSTYL